ncbi:MAG: hypothetical protein WCJ95_13885 [Mariniphaga sp.]
MNKNIINGQEEQINDMIERICEISGKPLPIGSVIGMIGKVIQMRENDAEDIAIRKQVSGVTGISLNDPRIDEVIFEIEEKPAQNTYMPFNNSQFEALKKQMDGE